MALDRFATISTFFTLEEISNAHRLHDKKAETLVLATIADARNKGYDSICIPLTTDKWKKRWSDMCLLPAGSDKDMQVAAEQRAEVWRSKPCFLSDEVSITRLGEWGICVFKNLP
jgi:protein arginine N-methyltransferase 5